MTCRQRDAGAEGFTLVEVVVVLAVLGVLMGTALPLASAFIDADRRQEVRGELDAIAEALEDYFYDRGAFPASLTAPGFYAVYLQPGVNDTVVEDPWGDNVGYVYRFDAPTNVATVHSRGEDRQDNGFGNEEFKVTVYGAVPGLAKTRLRMRVIVESLANYLETGGVLTGNWSSDRTALGLGAVYDTDGFGSAFTLDPGTMTLRSAGPDRRLNTGDDVTP